MQTAILALTSGWRIRYRCAGAGRGRWRFRATPVRAVRSDYFSVKKFSSAAAARSGRINFSRAPRNRSRNSSAVRSMFTTWSASNTNRSGTRSRTSTPVARSTVSCRLSRCWILSAVMTLIRLRAAIPARQGNALGLDEPATLLNGSSSTTQIPWACAPEFLERRESQPCRPR